MAAKVNRGSSVIQLERGKSREDCRRWQLRAPDGRDPETGESGTRTRVFVGTYAEAVRALRILIEEAEDPRAVWRRKALEHIARIQNAPSGLA